MKSRTNLHNQSPSIQNEVSSEKKRTARSNKLTGVYINEDTELFRLTREFSQEIPVRLVTF